MTFKPNPGGVADRVRSMAVDDVIVRAFRRPIADYAASEANEWLKSLHAQLTVLRKSTGFSLVVDSLPPVVVNDHVIKTTVVTRTA